MADPTVTRSAGPPPVRSTQTRLTEARSTQIGSTQTESTPAGFTLLELLAALLILAVLLTTGVPAFTDLLLNARMTAQVNRYVHAIHLARQTAHQALAQVALCKSADGLQCGHSMDWHDGWIVFVNEDRDHPPHVDPGERVVDVGNAFASGSVTANRTHFVFRPFETRSTNGTLIFCDRRGAPASRAVIVSTTGRPRTTRGEAADCGK